VESKFALYAHQFMTDSRKSQKRLF